jgi:hypothetical protein
VKAERHWREPEPSGSADCMLSRLQIQIFGERKECDSTGWGVSFPESTRRTEDRAPVLTFFKVMSLFCIMFYNISVINFGRTE